MTLLSTLISFLMGGLPKLLEFFQDRSDKKHELALAQMQTERELALRKAGLEAQERIEHIQTEQIQINAEVTNAQTALAERQALYAHDIGTAHHHGPLAACGNAFTNQQFPHTQRRAWHQQGRAQGQHPRAQGLQGVDPVRPVELERRHLRRVAIVAEEQPAVAIGEHVERHDGERIGIQRRDQRNRQVLPQRDREQRGGEHLQRPGHQAGE